jgi:hypothetical protein
VAGVAEDMKLFLSGGWLCRTQTEENILQRIPIHGVLFRMNPGILTLIRLSAQMRGHE